MLKQNKWMLLITSLVILLPMAAGLVLWERLPEQLATHWNAAGQPDGWSHKGFAVFGLPGFLLAVHWLCLLVTASDTKNKGQSQKVLGLTLWLCPAVSFLVNGVVYTTALGGTLRVEMIAPVFVGLLFLVIGNYLPKCKRNYTIGIKVSWALASEENWNATHRFAGRVWVAGSLLLIACGFFPGIALWGMLGVLLLLVVAPVVYSYMYYRKHR